MKILALKKSNSGSDYHRIELPLKYLKIKDDDLIITCDTKNGIKEEDFQNIDIVFWSRECPFDLDLIIRFKDKYGFKIVVDIDDHWRLYQSHYLVNVYDKLKTEENIINAIKIADLIFTTNEKLAMRISDINNEVNVITNALPFNQEQFTLSTDVRYVYDIKKEVLIYVAGVSHYSDFMTIRGALSKCKSDVEIQKKFTFMLCGYDNTNVESRTQWNKIENVAKYFGNCGRAFTRPLTEYMNHYNYGSVAIAPLELNSFNIYKSNLKTIEAGCKGLPIIASAIHPYILDEEMHGKGIFLAKNSKDWYYYIKKFAREEGLAKQMGETLYSYTKAKYDINHQNLKRYHLFKSIL